LSSPSKLLFVLLLFFANVRHDERLDPIEFLLKTGREIVSAVFEQDHEAKREKDKESDPKKSAHDRHVRKTNLAGLIGQSAGCRPKFGLIAGGELTS
jgi:hypothetical protein